MTGIRTLRLLNDEPSPSSSRDTAPEASRRRGSVPDRGATRSSRPLRPIRRLLRGWGVLVMVLAVGIGGCGGPAAPTAAPREAGTPLSTGAGPTGLAVHDDLLVVVHGDGSVVQITADGDVELLTERSDRLSAPLSAFGSLWVVQTGAGGDDEPEEVNGTVEYRLDAVVRIDPLDGTAVATIGDLGDELLLAATDDAVWVVGERSGQGGWVWRIDPLTNSATAVQEGDGVRGDRSVSTSVLVVVGEQLWLAGNCEAMPCPSGAARVRILEPATGELTTLDVELPDELMVSAAALVDGRLWFAGFPLGQLLGDNGSGRIVAVEATGEVSDQVEVGRFPTGLTFADDGLWLSDCLGGTLTRLDPMDGTVLQGPLVVGTPYPPEEPFDWYREDFSCPGAVVQVGDTIWVALHLDGTVVPVR